MFLTNGFQAFSDYKPFREDLYSSTMFDSKTKPDFNPEGRILISINVDNWVIDVRATYESRMLMLALIRYFVKQTRGDVRNTVDVENALTKLSSYGLLIRRLSTVLVEDNSFNAKFCYQYTLPRLKLKKMNDIIYTTVEYLKRIYQCSGLLLDTHLTNNTRRVSHIESNFYSHSVKDHNFLIFKTGNNLFLTNVKPNASNIALMKEVISISNDVRSKSALRQEGFNQMFWMTVGGGLLDTPVRIRPAIIYEQEDGVYNVLHRPFLFTEKSFGEIRKPVLKAVELLSMMT